VRVVLAPASDWRGSEHIHQRMAVLRGVEAGFSLARAARGGMVSATDSRGRRIAVQMASPIDDAIATADLPLGPGHTVYTRHGDWFGKLSLIFTIVLMLRLGVSILYAPMMRRIRPSPRVKPSGVISVDVGNQPKAEPDEPQNEVYRPPSRPPSD
jgi:hypothetical protein